MADPRAVVGELERAAGLGCVGAMVYGRTGETTLDDPRYDDLFAAAAALGQPIFIHPQIPPPTVRQAAYTGFNPLTELALSTFGWGWHLEAALAALRLIVRGTFDRHPDLQIVLAGDGFEQEWIQPAVEPRLLARQVAQVARALVLVPHEPAYAGGDFGGGFHGRQPRLGWYGHRIRRSHELHFLV